MSSSNASTNRPRGRWNPYAVGAAIGVLCWGAFAIANKPIGISSSLEAVAGFCAEPLLGQLVDRNAYLAKYTFALNYGVLFLGGVFLGALLSALVSGTWRVETVPAVWRSRFGSGRLRRLAAAFAGGLVLMFGARLAGGCTSGHGISGCLQLALSSWVFFLTLFAAGIVAAHLLYGRNPNSHREG